MHPYIVQAITDKDGRIIKSFGAREIRRVVSPATTDKIKKMMRSVIHEGGTGVKAALKGYSICGKTGTAQKIDKNGLYAKDKYIASFIGFVPVDNPEVAILVVVDEPAENHYGGVVAAPAFKKIAYETMNYLSIPPDQKIHEFTVAIQNEAKG